MDHTKPVQAKNDCDLPRKEETKVRFTMIIPALQEANPTELIQIRMKLSECDIHINATSDN